MLIILANQPQSDIYTFVSDFSSLFGAAITGGLIAWQIFQSRKQFHLEKIHYESEQIRIAVAHSIEAKRKVLSFLDLALESRKLDVDNTLFYYADAPPDLITTRK